ncbi:DUF4249 domain-containing protein [Flagellimonas pelagia]|uniref:DUF4249 domain-containing protein n=1 Tax=Flagellimonas pelagia TaxID=2306998 RepID=A0A3A1NL32_9FLAO|nr:DUF4249 domain-containing protein [Allomuricauda maritima]RIV46973.1 DUF4249 domain-containing protein [Allomuricauda maritima]TXJ99862.1 DUF4249 domain-containing protein [Allomuricauda maritima]
MKVLRCIWFLIILSCCWACLDELEIDTLTGDGQSATLVVEAVLTDEMITQKVYLSRSDARLDLETDTVYNPYIPLGSLPIDSVDMEAGATVRVLGENGVEYQFTEGSEGIYLSNQPFALQMGIGYILEIQTSNGREYVSDPLVVQGKSKFTNVYAEKAISNSGEEGIAIYVDSEPQEGNTEYYRYAYEETYKIVAPYWRPVDFELTGYDNTVFPPLFNLDVVERQIQNEICYNTVSSTTIDQFSTAGSPESEVSKHMVRFIGKDNFIISHRYSILVQQQVQSADAYSFYKTLKSFSQSDNIFSQIQPGALYANVHRKDGTNENVLGYAEAVGVSDQRLFLNFDDFFPGEQLPPFVFDCNFQSAKLYNEPTQDPCPQGLLERINAGIVSYYSPYDESLVPNASCPGPYVFLPKICGDCTLLGSNIKPDFWEE